MTTFTASEVRDQARLLDGLSRQMLNRFAERRTALIEMVRRGDAEEFQKGWPMLERAP